MSANPPPDFMLSVLLVFGDDRQHLRPALDRLHAALTASYRQFEVICIDNGSSDSSQEVAIEAVGRLPNIRYIRLTREYPDDVARICAIEQAIGDVAVTFDPVTDAPDAIGPLITSALGGAVAVARRPRHTGIVRTLAARLFYRVIKVMVHADLALDEGDQRAYPRSALTALSKIRSKRRNLRLANALIGFRQELVDVPHGPARRRERFSTAVRRGLDLLFSHSSHPLRWANWLGLFAATGNLVYLGYVAVVNLVMNDVAKGWTTLSATNSVMFFLLFLILTILAEYVGRILDEVQDRPLYFVEFERDGAVRLGEKVVNVV